MVNNKLPSVLTWSAACILGISYGHDPSIKFLVRMNHFRQGMPTSTPVSPNRPWHIAIRSQYSNRTFVEAGAVDN